MSLSEPLPACGSLLGDLRRWRTRPGDAGELGAAADAGGGPFAGVTGSAPLRPGVEEWATDSSFDAVAGLSRVAALRATFGLLLPKALS